LLPNLREVLPLLQPNMFLCKIDFHAFFFHIPIAQNSRATLRFIYEDQLLQFTCLPFGSSSAPHAAQTLTNWLVRKLREKGVLISGYLDDFLVLGATAAAAAANYRVTVTFLSEMGFFLSQKSVPHPTQVLEYLGIIFNME